ESGDRTSVLFRIRKVFGIVGVDLAEFDPPPGLLRRRDSEAHTVGDPPVGVDRGQIGLRPPGQARLDSLSPLGRVRVVQDLRVKQMRGEGRLPSTEGITETLPGIFGVSLRGIDPVSLEGGFDDDQTLFHRKTPFLTFSLSWARRLALSTDGPSVREDTGSESVSSHRITLCMSRSEKGPERRAWDLDAQPGSISKPT